MNDTNRFRLAWIWGEVTCFEGDPKDTELKVFTDEQTMRETLMGMYQDCSFCLPYSWGRQPHGCDCGDFEEHAFIEPHEDGDMIFAVRIQEVVLAPGEVLEVIEDVHGQPIDVQIRRIK